MMRLYESGYKTNDAKATGFMTVTIKIWMDTTLADPNDAIGVFGLRLVPDVQ